MGYWRSDIGYRISDFGFQILDFYRWRLPRALTLNVGASRDWPLHPRILTFAVTTNPYAGVL